MTPLPGGFSVTHFESAGSTNDLAKVACKDAYAVDGTVYWTGDQTAGRGTHGRVWTAPAGNLAVSIVKRPRIAMRFAPQAGIVTAVAVADALVSLGFDASRVGLKWPNDVLVDGKKICGILLEGAAAGPVVEWLVIGTGMNVKHHPPETRHPATDMTEAGVPVSLEDALSAYLMSFKRWWGRWRRYDFQVVATAWAAKTVHKPGQTINVSEGGTRSDYIFKGMGSDGELVVADQDGVEKFIVSGEIFAPDAMPPKPG